LKSPDFLENVSSGFGDETILPVTKPFSAFGAGIWKQRMVIKLKKQRRTAPASITGDSQMRTFSFMLAVAFVLAGPSMAGSLDGSLPGIGTFAYNGSASEPLVVAAR
jgi:hypothetical protein